MIFPGAFWKHNQCLRRVAFLIARYFPKKFRVLILIQACNVKSYSILCIQGIVTQILKYLCSVNLERKTVLDGP